MPGSCFNQLLGIEYIESKLQRWRGTRLLAMLLWWDMQIGDQAGY